MREVSDAHADMLSEVPEMSLPHRACACVNKAGHMLLDIAATFKCVISTGRTWGDDGQPPCHLNRENGKTCVSRPDHVLLTGRLFCAAQSGLTMCVDTDLTPRMFDHCPITMTFNVTQGKGDHID